MPGSLVATLQNNRAAVELTAVFLSAVGYTLATSIILAPAGASLAAIGAVLVGLANGCSLEGSLQAHARMAATGARVMVAVCAIGAILVLPSAPVLGTFSVLFLALVPVFDALGAGRAPRLSDVLSLGGAIGSVSALDEQSTNTAAAGLGRQAHQVASNPQVRAALARLESGGSVATTSDADLFVPIDTTILVAFSRHVNEGADAVERILLPLTDAAVTPRGYHRLKVAMFLRDWRAAGRPLSFARALAMWELRHDVPDALVAQYQPRGSMLGGTGLVFGGRVGALPSIPIRTGQVPTKVGPAGAMPTWAKVAAGIAAGGAVLGGILFATARKKRKAA